MGPRPYATAAKAPASRTAATTSSVNLSIARLLGAVRIGRGALPRRRVDRRDDRRGPVGLILLHHERGVRLLPELGGAGHLPPRPDSRDLHRALPLSHLCLVDPPVLPERRGGG